MARIIFDLLTLVNGQENSYFDEVAELTAEIETLACELRNKLEDLSNSMQHAWQDDEEIMVCDNEGNEYNSDDIQDFANNVAEIEDIFNLED